MRPEGGGVDREAVGIHQLLGCGATPWPRQAQPQYCTRTSDAALHLRIGRLTKGWQAAPGTRRYRCESAQIGAATETAVPQAAALEQEPDPGPVTAIRRHLPRSTVRGAGKLRGGSGPGVGSGYDFQLRVAALCPGG